VHERKISMGVYINGMEMPKSCDECPLYTCMHNHDDCPLVPVPPHGRLIDADVLITRYEKQRAEDGDIICDERAFQSDYEKAMYRYSRNSDIISALKSQAAVIPAEEGE
jgi:hypothetical protein